MSNMQRFRDAYTETLTAAVQKHPEEYHYPLAEVPKIVDKMTKALATGGANLGPAIKAAARKLGLKPTQRDIKRYLNLDNCPCAASMGVLCFAHANGTDPSLPCDASEQR